MRPTLTVRYTLWFDEERTVSLAGPQSLLCLGCHEGSSEAEEVIDTLCMRVIDEAVWEDWFRVEDREETVWVSVTAPAWLQGFYEVTLSQQIVATSRKLRDIADPDKQGGAHGG